VLLIELVIDATLKCDPANYSYEVFVCGATALGTTFIADYTIGALSELANALTVS
jgi:hypothetical protein